jgi:hypothetical protein
MILTPGVALGSAIGVVRSLQWHATSFLQALKEIGLRVLIIAASLFGPVVVGLSPLLAAGSFIGYLQMGLSNSPGLRSLYDLLGEVAKLLVATTKFIRLLLGPRSDIKNPILAGLLHFADELAKLFPFALALVAVIVTHLGPLLIPIADSIKAMAGLLSRILDTIVFIFEQFVAQLMEVFSGPDNIASPLARTLEGLTGGFVKIVPAFNTLLDTASTVLEDSYNDVRAQVEKWRSTLGTNLKALIRQDPTWVKTDRLIDALKIAATMLGHPSPSTSSTPSPFDPWIAEAKKWAGEGKEALKSAPELPNIETPGGIIDRLGLETKYGVPRRVGPYKGWVESGLPPVATGVTRYVERARHPASAFAYEKKALAAEYGAKTPKDALDKAHTEELELRSAIEAVVGRVLPPALRRVMPSLVDTFQMFDQSVSLDAKSDGDNKTRKNTKAIEFPVMDLPPDNGLLRPVVQRLVLHSKSGRREDLRDFLGELKKRFDQPYPVLQ